MTDEVGRRPDVVVVGAVCRNQAVADLLLLAAEYDAGVTMHRQFTGIGRSNNGRPVGLVGKVPHVLLQYLGQDVKGAVLIGLPALCYAQDDLPGFG